ncbi:Superoxide reductase [Candidatus Tiddalikarchaeum anstoanum]|nr:Superoxide reductase [Candidatus Tiddalikarchaeum anstoanum]
MDKIGDVYKCNVCRHIIQVLHASDGTLVCCGQPMELLKEKHEEAGLEKHVPIIEKMKTGIKVKVGSIPHPMEETHYIEWIQLIADGVIYRKFLKPGDKPEAKFPAKMAKMINAKIYCNVHGLWKN